MKPVQQIFLGLALIALCGIGSAFLFRVLPIPAGGGPTPAHWVAIAIVALVMLTGWFITIRGLLRIFWKR